MEGDRQPGLGNFKLQPEKKKKKVQFQLVSTPMLHVLVLLGCGLFIHPGLVDIILLVLSHNEKARQNLQDFEKNC